MIYLDYAADTPVSEDVLQTFCEVSRQYPGNPNSSHQLGRAASARLDQSTKQIARLMQVKDNEIIYTSGASESNNLAIKGIAETYKKYGRHIITTYLEHSSVNGAVAALQRAGFEVDYVDILPSGLVDLEHLKQLLRKDTVLVSICCVDSEIGIRQEIEKIGQLLLDYPHCFFHVDATQAVGKIPVSLEHIDLLTFAPHKFNGLNGCGILIKKEAVMLEPMIYGGASTTPFRSGTPALALIAAAERALTLSFEQMQPRYEHAAVLKQKLRAALKKYPKVRINSTNDSVPFICNISITGAKAERFQSALEEKEIYLSTKSACCAPNTVSRPVYALTKDRKAALSTLRISVSHLTSTEDIEVFLDCFDGCYREFVNQEI